MELESTLISKERDLGILAESRKHLIKPFNGKRTGDTLTKKPLKTPYTFEKSLLLPGRAKKECYHWSIFIKSWPGFYSVQGFSPFIIQFPLMLIVC